jgi:hypothetical protein
MGRKIKEKAELLVKDEAALLHAIWIVLAILLGTVVRLQFISGSDFPINDGGLFYQMVEDLLDNELVIPEYTMYNQDKIPFAYPPLAFYLIAILHILTKISLFSLLRYVPALISIITIIAFYILAKEILDDQMLSGIAAVLFSVIPRSFEWFVMGGGITRALGFLFAILSIHGIWQLFSGKKRISAVLRTAIFSGLTVLSHPETALFVVFVAIVLIFYHGISKTNILNSIYVALGVLVIISPWIISVIAGHGLDPFTSAGGTGHELWFEIKNIITFKFGFENGEFLSVYSGLALIAVFLKRDKLTWVFFGLLVFGYLFFPRSGPNLLTIWVTLLAALGLKELLTHATKAPSMDKKFTQIIESDGKAKIILIVVILYLFLGAYTYKFIYGKDKLHLTDEIYETFLWVEENTDLGSKFLLYPSTEGNRFWWNDYLSEWFPVIADRHSVSTVQGYEWTPDMFDLKVMTYSRLRSCEIPGPRCVERWENDNKTEIDYIVIDLDENRPDFLNSFKIENGYELVYDGNRLAVFKKE